MTNRLNWKVSSTINPGYGTRTDNLLTRPFHFPMDIAQRTCFRFLVLKLPEYTVAPRLIGSMPITPCHSVAAKALRLRVIATIDPVSVIAGTSHELQYLHLPPILLSMCGWERVHNGTVSGEHSVMTTVTTLDRVMANMQPTRVNTVQQLS